MRKKHWLKQIEFSLMWGDLATYNTEKSRGIVHTPEHQARMAEKQAAYIEWSRNGAGKDW